MTRVLFDAFHHMMPGHRIGRHIAVGGYRTNYGRYTPGDCFHPNGLSFLHADLAPRYDLRLLTAPYTPLSLFDADILFVTNPDYPLYEGASPHRWTPADVDGLWAFAERGGGVLLSINSFLSRPDFWEENFDIERVSLLFDRLGLRWDPNYMSDDNTIEVGRSGPFRVGYGQGGRVVGNALPAGVEPLITRDEHIYGFRTRIGQGKLAVLGDAGLASNGLVCFPGFDNAAFLHELFDGLAPRWHDGPGRAWDVARFGHLSAAPGKQGMTEDLLRGLRPSATWEVDHHYRHLTWEGRGDQGQGETVWGQLPVPLEALSADHLVHGRLHWLRLDGDRPGPEMKVELTARPARGRDTTDWHVLGRARSDNLTWADLLENPAHAKALGKVEQVHGVFEMRVVCDADDECRAARWSQGQIVYARSAAAAHYGWEIMLTSASGVIVPRALD
jgi:hypothetical protein